MFAHILVVYGNFIFDLSEVVGGPALLFDEVTSKHFPRIFSKHFIGTRRISLCAGGGPFQIGRGLLSRKDVKKNKPLKLAKLAMKCHLKGGKSTDEKGDVTPTDADPSFGRPDASLACAG